MIRVTKLSEQGHYTGKTDQKLVSLSAFNRK